MNRFELTNDLCTGITDIDDQHRTILELGNRVVALSAIREDEKIIEEALRFLTDYVVYHFAAEEYAMTQFRFPNADHHRAWHGRFRNEVLGYVDRTKIIGLPKDLRLQVSFAFENWLLEHVRITDLGLARFLQQHRDKEEVSLPTVGALETAGKLPAGFVDRIAAISLPGPA